MSHILEVVIAAFLVGLAGSVVGFLIEKKIRDRIEKGRTSLLWMAVYALLGAAALVVVLGFYADSLTFRFSSRTVSIQIPNPQAAASGRPVSLLLLLSLAAAFFLFLRSVDLSFRTDEIREEFDPSLGLLRLPKTVAVVSTGITTALMFQFFKSRLYAGWWQPASIPLPLALVFVNFAIGKVAIALIKHQNSPRIEGAVTVLWSSLSYVILVLAFIR